MSPLDEHILNPLLKLLQSLNFYYSRHLAFVWNYLVQAVIVIDRLWCLWCVNNYNRRGIDVKLRHQVT